jgi:hypothetical protein
MAALTNDSSFGANPTRIKWTVVRGDTAKLKVEFWQNDETTKVTTSTWTYESSAYDLKGDVLDTLQVTSGDGYVQITAPPEVTSTWGTGYNAVSAELSFDLQVTIGGTTVWTPIIGTIVVLSDITPNANS